MQMHHLLSKITCEKQFVGSTRCSICPNRIVPLRISNGINGDTFILHHPLAFWSGPLPGKVRTGNISTLRHYRRWSSDGFEIVCGNGEEVRVIFALDTCDWKVMAFSATTSGYSADMAQGVMLACAGKRLGDVKTLQLVELISDNGSNHKGNSGLCHCDGHRQ